MVISYCLRPLVVTSRRRLCASRRRRLPPLPVPSTTSASSTGPSGDDDADDNNETSLGDLCSVGSHHNHAVVDADSRQHLASASSSSCGSTATAATAAPNSAFIAASLSSPLVLVNARRTCHLCGQRVAAQGSVACTNRFCDKGDGQSCVYCHACVQRQVPLCWQPKRLDTVFSE